MLSDDNRMDIWKGYLTELLKHPDIILFGVGMDSCNVLGKIVGIGNPHNVIIEKVVECGFIGLILNVGVFYPMIVEKNMKFSNIYALPFYVYL